MGHRGVPGQRAPAVSVAQTIVVRDAAGEDAYELTAADGEVRVRQLPISFKEPKVPIESLREGVAALYAMATEGGSES